MRKKFNARVEAVFKAIDIDKSGELSLPQMERVFGEETHDFWEDMDGETGNSVIVIVIRCMSFPVVCKGSRHTRIS